MSEFGLKIKNIKAGTLYEYNLGVRDHYEYKDAMFTLSLFHDFLLENGLNVWKGEFTRDIICLDFDYGSRSFDDEYKHLSSLVRKYGGTLQDSTIIYENKKKKEVNTPILDKLQDIINEALLNKNRYAKKTMDEIRIEYYENGVDVPYIVKNKKGKIISNETIHYKMLYRTTGKAKKGSCMFINENLYDKAIDFLRMGIVLSQNKAPIVEIGAYSSLVTSTIVDKIKINPKNILVLKDIDSFFKTKVISVETDEKRKCIAKTIDNYELKNTLFDGQALIDSSIFPSNADGYILLRHHFCKMAAFCSNIQLFFRDYYGENYQTAKITDMFGIEHYVKDIELITTDNSMKWLKFDISYDYWCNKVYENSCMFGIVKTAHQSKLGNVQKMSYQMVNSLDINIMEQVCETSVKYTEKLKQDNEEFLRYLEKNKNFSNDFEVLIALCEKNPLFVRSDYFRQRKSDIIKTYLLNVKSGKLIQEADNLVIVGSPYAMLLYSVGENVEKDDTFKQEEGTIQCYTGRFADGEYLAGFRSPFNSKNNMNYLHNVYNDKLLKYFNFGKQIIAVNLIHTDFQDRNNGSDQDSDSLYCTNNLAIVECARDCYKNYSTIVNNIPKETNSYTNTLENFAKIDNNLAAAQRAIGESSNLAQICLTYTYNNFGKDEKYINYVCILSVLAQVAIDNAKRRFAIDLNAEIDRIKQDMKISHYGYPEFWSLIRKDFNKDRINKDINCPMNYLCNDMKIAEIKPKEKTLTMDKFLIKHKPDIKNRRTSKKVEELIEQYSLKLFLYNKDKDNDSDNNEDYIMLRQDFDKLITDIRNLNISRNYTDLMMWLLDRAFCFSVGAKRNKSVTQSTIKKNKSILIKTLYEVSPKIFMSCFLNYDQMDLTEEN